LIISEMMNHHQTNGCDQNMKHFVDGFPGGIGRININDNQLNMVTLCFLLDIN